MKGYATMPNCCSCGKFMRVEPGASHKLIIPSDYWNGPDREVYQCKKCTEANGPLEPGHGAAEWTAGLIAE